MGGCLSLQSLDGATKIFLAALAVIMFVLPFAFSTHTGAAFGLLFWGAAAFAIVPPVQMRVMLAASEAPGLASSINVGAFNLGNAVGAAIGAGVISMGLGYAFVSFAGGLLAAAGLLMVFAGRKTESAATPVLQEV